MKLTEEKKEKCIEELIKAGAIRRESSEKHTVGSLGKKGLPVLEIRI